MIRPASLALAALALIAAPAAAQRRQPTPEQRIDRLEKQVRQVQRQVFPKGQPADTAGFSDAPAATLDSVTGLSSRLDAVERQMADVVRATEENGNRLATMEAEVARLRAEQDRRFRALESGSAPASEDQSVDATAPAEDGPPPAPRPKVETDDGASASATPVPAADAESAYDAGYQLWNAKKYDAAIKALKEMVAAYPDSRRVSWANNLIGRALLDKGQPRAAAEVLLSNYRGNPKGERAQDSLYYLGQSLMKLGQASQACKAYAELEDVYATSLRSQLKGPLNTAKREARCG